MFFHEISRLCFGILNGNADERHLFLREFFINFFKISYFPAARNAPGGIEVNEYGFALVVAKTKAAAIEKLDGKIRSRPFLDSHPCLFATALKQETANEKQKYEMDASHSFFPSFFSPAANSRSGTGRRQ